jgi:Fuc2NAc and GlcNAc transferase
MLQHWPVLVVPAAVCTWLLLAGLIPLLQRQMLDQPNARSSHSRPTPRGGGLAFVLVSCLAWAFLGQWGLLVCLPLAVVGLIDDWRSLPAGLRFGAQVLTASALLLQAKLPGVSSWIWLAPLLVIGATAVINATNFMDGMDALVAGCITVVLSVAALEGSPQLWPVVGALLGFLCWNWSPARVFMGDAGSTFLGAVLVATLFTCRTWAHAAGLLLVAMPLLADAGSCLLRRWLNGQSLVEAHRLHLYQRLHQAGWSHRCVSSLYIGMTIVQAILVLAGGWRLGLLGAVVVAGLGFSLDRRQAVPFNQPGARQQAGSALRAD